VAARFDPNHPRRVDALAAAQRLAAEVGAAARAYNQHHTRFPKVKVRCIEPFKLGADCGFSPSRWAVEGEVVELPSDLAGWLCSTRAGRRAEKVG
jgi:hypothetical protein